MNKTLLSRKIFSWGSLALATSLLVSLLVPSAQANTYSLPNAPTNVTSYLGAKGVVVKWTAGASVAPGVTGHVVSAGAGSCPIFVPIGNNSVVTMPVVVGQPAGTPVVQIIPFKRTNWTMKVNEDLSKDLETNYHAEKTFYMSEQYNKDGSPNPGKYKREYRVKKRYT